MAVFSSNIVFQIVVDGKTVEGLLHVSIVTSNCFSSDRYSLTFAMGPPPLCDISYWSDLSSAYVTVSVITDSQPVPQGLISGMVDMVHIDPVNGMVTLEGRDLSSCLIDAYRQQDFVNQTASEVVSAIASNHGLTPVITATSSIVGRYYGDGYTRLSLGQYSRLRSDWDVVVELARENSFDVFVQGTSLFFQPSLTPDNLPVPVYLRDIKSMRFECALNLASGPTARVQSWNSQNMASYDSDLSQEGSNATANIPNMQPFLFCGSNFTSQQSTDSAARYAAELSHLNTVLEIEMPWNLQLVPRTVIMIKETNSSLDKSYIIDSIERRYSTTAGSIQVVRAAAI